MSEQPDFLVIYNEETPNILTLKTLCRSLSPKSIEFIAYGKGFPTAQTSVFETAQRIIFFGYSNKSDSINSDWLNRLEKARVCFIAFPDEFILRIGENNRFSIDLSSTELSPVEKLVALLELNLRHQDVWNCFDFSYDNKPQNSSIRDLSVGLKNEQFYRPLKQLAFAQLPELSRKLFRPALMLMKRTDLALDRLDNSLSFLPVFLFSFDTDQCPCYTGDRIELKKIKAFEFYATASHATVFQPDIPSCPELDPGFTSRDCPVWPVEENFQEDERYQHALNDCCAKISQACYAIMNTHRFLHRYGCTFYLPFYAGTTEYCIDRHAPDPTTPYVIKYGEGAHGCTEQAQAFVYFSPPIQDSLFDTDGQAKNNALQPIREWSLNNLKRHSDPQEYRYQWHLDLPGSHNAMTANITDIRLYQYFNKLMTLSITIKPHSELADTDASIDFEADNWWCYPAFGSVSDWSIIKQNQIYDWLEFTKLARLLFPTFVQQEDEQKWARNYITQSDSENKLAEANTESNQLSIEGMALNRLSDVIVWFLSRFFKEEDLSSWFKSVHHQVFDDRMFVNVAYGYTGPQCDEAHLDRLFKLALFVDREGDTFQDLDGYAYDPEFLESLTSVCRYDRWRKMGTLSGYTNYSNVYLGHNWYFCNIIAKDHIPLIYGRMLLMTLFYQASLRFYNRKVMLITEKLPQGNQTIEESLLFEIQQLRKEFIRFTNVYWFHDVTSQIQGQEIFDKQQQALELNRDYAFIKDEMERLDEYLQGCYNLESTKSSGKLNTILFSFTCAALILTIYEISIAVFTSDEMINLYIYKFLPIDSLNWWLEKWLQLMPVFIIAVFVFVLYFGLKFLFHRKRQ